jgi:glycosyltransferase involved in cell wall biosynthesis
MKIAVIFDAEPEMGGAFHQSVSAIKQFMRISSRYEVELFHLREGSGKWLVGIDQPSTYLRRTLRSQVAEGILRSSFHSIAERLGTISSRENFLLSAGIDLAYFPTPSPFCQSLQILNYIATIYDVCYQDFPEFPEVGQARIWHKRRLSDRRMVGRAVLTIADSEELKAKLCHMYGAANDRILTMPYTALEIIGTQRGVFCRDAISKYVGTFEYLFYPAHFWAHKNHVRILQSLQLLEQKGIRIHVAFAGVDYGTRSHVARVAANLGVVDQVHFLGFVPSEDLALLYQGAIALIMPTYFGPTNIPPLEAWALSVPVIYSRHLSNGIEEGVLAIDPDSAQSIAEAIAKITQEPVRQKLIAGGQRCLARIKERAHESEKELEWHLERFSRRRATWK